MTSIAYRVYDLPVKGVGAFCPVPAITPIYSSYGEVALSGSPGTMPIPAPSPQSIWCVPISVDPKTQSSNCSPDVKLPDIYIPYADNMGPSMHFGMAARRQTPIPVPAVSWINSALTAMGSSKIGGRVAAAWPRAFQRWPSIRNLNANPT